MYNPFHFGGPIPIDRFIGRKREVRRIASRLMGGQSSAVVGEPRSGKTSLLYYLKDSDLGDQLFEHGGARMLFNYLDAHTVRDDTSLEGFWDRALVPLRTQNLQALPQVGDAYHACEARAFAPDPLEHLFEVLGQQRVQLVLLLDEMDELLFHPKLNSSDFFGSLRSLSSRLPGLAVVTGSRQRTAILNRKTQDINPTSSPFFNTQEEILLGPLEHHEVTRLIEPAGRHFKPKDQAFITRLAGGHPYLLHMTASKLWDAREDGRTGERSYREVGHLVHDQAAATVADSWRLWSPHKRKVFAGIALAHLGTLAEGHELLDKRTFYVERLLEDIRSFRAEQRSLQNQGFIVEDKTSFAGWRIGPEVYLWWMAEEIVRTVRDDKPFEEWLGTQEWGQVLTSGERDQLNDVARSVGGFFEGGINTLIESVAKSLAGGS